MKTTKTGRRWLIALLALAVIAGAVAAARADVCGEGDGCAEPALVERARLPIVMNDAGIPPRPVPPTPPGNGP